MDTPKCEICGEDDVAVQTDHVGMCDDCAADAIRSALAEAGLFEKVCGNISRQRNGYLTTCLAPYGVEHDHS
jgi:hypothetical protein